MMEVLLPNGRVALVAAKERPRLPIEFDGVAAVDDDGGGGGDRDGRVITVLAVEVFLVEA